MTSQDGQEPRDHGVVGKHEVFLSYSRKQRDFVEQLDKDLRNCGYSPFFDRDEYSLPVTENTTNNICAAIRQCEVAIVVLSEDFLSLTIWPMFELAYMVECKTRIIPIFYGISPADLDDVDKRNKWLLDWEKWADNVKENPDKEKLVRIPEWDKALNSLGPTQGFVYNATQGSVKLRTEIVKEINSRVSPFPDYSYVQGGARFCQIICEKIFNTPVSQAYGKQVVGLYGVGGIGKTTSCKYLCKHYYKELDGRVCHIEFDTAKSEKDRLQEVFTKLMKLNSEVSKNWSEEECYQKLEKGLQLQRIFLAIDNVLDKTQIYEETKRYIRLGAGSSIVLVTARSPMIITKELKIHDHIAMPDLETHEAQALFLKYAVPKLEFENAPYKEDVDEKLLNQCIRRCYFSKGKNSNFHYHPLALKVLGSQLESMDYSKWWLHLKDKETFNRFREYQDPVFSILRNSFDDLQNDRYKIMFLDVVLFDTKSDYGLDEYDHYNHDGGWNIFKWLSTVHGLSVNDVHNQLRHLKRKSLLEELGDGTTIVGVHDLWREFAKVEANAWKNKSPPWLYEIWESEDQESKLHDGGWKKLQRISIRGDRNSTTTVKSIDFSNCSKVTVLKLVCVNVEENALNLGLLNRLKSLRIECRFDEYLVQEMKSLENLKILSWNITGSLPSTTIITFPPKLQVLRLTCYDREYKHQIHATHETSSTRPTLDLGGLRSLQEARIDFSGKVHISGLSSEMTKLRILNLRGCYCLPSLPGVGNTIGMTTLILDNCKSLKMLPRLQMLTKLRRLGIAYCESLTAVPGLGSLVALELLHAFRCESLHELPDVSSLTKLRILNLRGCKSLTAVPGLGSLVALEELDADGCQSLHELPDVSNLTKLRILNLRDCKSLTAVPGLGSLVALMELDADGCESLHELPDVSNLTKLQILNLWGCKSLTAVPGLGSVVALEELWLWECESLHELPDVSNLTKLRTLNLRDCKSLTAVPGFGSLVALELLDALGCQSLHELPDVSNLTKLQILNLWGCKSLTAVPGLGSLVALEELRLRECESLHELPDVSNLTKLRILNLRGWKSLTAVPGLESLVALEELDADGCESLHELPDVSNLTKLRILNLRGLKLLTAVLGLGSLVALEELDADGCESLHELPDVSNLTKLGTLYLRGCMLLTAVRGLGSLVALELLDALGCESLHELPDVSNLTKLRTLNLRGCKWLTAVPGLGSLVALEKLDADGCESLHELPDVSCLIKLRTLGIAGCKSLTAVPGLGSLVALEELDADGCQSLHELPDVSNLTKLRTLGIAGCKSLTAVPGLGSLVALMELDADVCENLHELPDVSNLTKLQILNLWGCKSLTAVPGLGSLVALEELWLWECESLHELPDVSNLTKLRTLNLRDCKWLTAVPGLGSLVALEELDSDGCESLHELPFNQGNALALESCGLFMCIGHQLLTLVSRSELFLWTEGGPCFL
ncbi:hypothetical protein KC19_5G132000 [Ceratodon purpureus]|uniref:TIR domain-containing protein n=1 Tax=Ceratodon purpureus TaxID=3225 RepID=A0A8T0I263_CERPU|nr:hypothetical protein KC19_5G132000 [Ceratodon purpureus]